MYLDSYNSYYAPMIYTAPCVMLFMRADPLQGQVGRGWALEIECHFGPKKVKQAHSCHRILIAVNFNDGDRLLRFLGFWIAFYVVDFLWG
jgi:hypothetical protein